jgi:hypothetical protein
MQTIVLASMAPQTQQPENTSLPANSYETKGLASSTTPLEQIFVLTPVPTIVLDSSLHMGGVR